MRVNRRLFRRLLVVFLFDLKPHYGSTNVYSMAHRIMMEQM